MWGLNKKYDWWSVLDGLEKVIDYYYEGNERDSLYWDHYSDQINEMGGIAGEMYEEMQEIRCRLDYKYNLPYKKIEFYEEDDCVSIGIAWWNTAACMLHDTDMETLIDNENPDFYGDYEREKEKRIRSLERLTKKQQMILYTEVIGFIERYMDLMAAFETITAVIRELEYHQSFVNAKGGIVAPNEAYL